jgi:hypothetical protein
MIPKSPTPQSISRLLASAGYERAASSPSRVKGLRNWSEGFAVEGYGYGEVFVHHVLGSFHPGERDRAHRLEEEGRYAETIKAAGYEVRRSTVRRGLIVSSSPATPEET